MFLLLSERSAQLFRLFALASRVVKLRLWLSLTTTVSLAVVVPALGSTTDPICCNGDTNGLNVTSGLLGVVLSGPGVGALSSLVAAYERGMVLNGWNTSIPNANNVTGKYKRLRNRCTNAPIIVTAKTANKLNNTVLTALVSVPNKFPTSVNGLLSTFFKAKPVRA